MKLLESCITDLRSLIAVGKIMKRQGRNVIVLPHALYDRLSEESNQIYKHDISWSQICGVHVTFLWNFSSTQRQ